MKQAFLSLFLFAALSQAAAAQQRLESPIRGEILTGWQQADGTRIAAIRLELEPGWKTYWRSPGDAGIPPQIDWKNSRNLAGVGLIWPTPRVYREGGVTTIGYKDVLVLPLSIAPKRAGQPITLRAALDIGVCKDVCIPHQMSLSATIDDAVTRPTPAIAAALAARPLSASEGRVRDATCRLSPNADGLEIVARVTMPSLGGREVVVIEPGSPDIWMSETDVTRQGGALTAIGDMAAMGGNALVLDRSDITITVLGRDRAVEIQGCDAG
ncbi:MAG: hypothetical protein HKN30_07430 [Sulfitobacter sp.]|nr:hypothetical protein [Sulfitobacter sp.]